MDALQYKIEKGIKIGAAKGRGGRDIIGTIKNMNIGDSILVKDKKEHDIFRSSLHQAQARGSLPTFIKMAARKQSNGRYRIWRVS